MNNRIGNAELSLLGGRWHENLLFSSPIALKILRDAVSGDFPAVFESDPARELLRYWSNTGDDGQFSGGFKTAFPLQITSIENEADRELVTLAVGGACLHAFLQENFTGPNLEISPEDLISSSGTLPPLDGGVLNRLAINELSYGGEPAYHLMKKAAFLRIAQLIFALKYAHLTSVPWWVLRVTTIHQQILGEPVGLPDSFFTQLDPLLDKLDDDFRGRLLLERGLLHHTLGNDRSAAQLFVRAARALGLEYELTGAMGKKTKFQENDISQLVLLAQSRRREEEDGDLKDGVFPNQDSLPEEIPLNDDTLLEQTQFTSSTSATLSSTNALTHLDPAAQPPLHPLDQCILLALCLNVRNTQPQHGLTTEQMTPYVARVLSHPRNWSVYSMALLLRSRLESTRSRTVERSTFQLQALIDQMPTSDSTLSDRLLYIHSIALPSKWEMERELAIRYLSLGVVRSAMEIFERLEMWEEVVKCWQSMERPEKGIVIVRDLLEGRKEEADIVLARGKAATEPRRERMDTAREAKLWCLLGDLEPKTCLEHYTKAWEISNHTSGRAARSLGGFFFARNQFTKAIPCLRDAVAINPLLSRTWFILGCACLREERWLDARDAFARCVAIDEDDGESWNNLASVYLRMGAAGSRLLLTEDGELEEVCSTVNHTFPPSNRFYAPQGANSDVTMKSDQIPFENAMLAFRALKQGIKFSYDNWRMWQNYMIVCLEVGELAEACRALGRVVEELSEKEGEASLDLDVLERLVDAVVHGPPPSVALNTPRNPNEGRALLPRVMDLFVRIILPRISSSARVFRAYARLLIWQQDRWGDALEAHMDAYRCSVVSDEKVETDLGQWRLAVDEVLDLVDILRNIGPRVGAEGDQSNNHPSEKRVNWQFQARSVVRTFMGRTKGSFGEEAEWEKLTAVLQDIKSA
jgi:tetratricopeptide repeat protein 27